MGKKSPKTPIQEKAELSEKVRFSFVGRLSSHGASYHIRVPKSEIEFFDLLPGDQLLVAINAAKLVRPAAESSD